MYKIINKTSRINLVFILFTCINFMLLAISLISKKFTLSNNKLIFFIFNIWCTFFIFYLVYKAITAQKYEHLNSYTKNIIIIVIISIQAIFSYYLFYLGYEKFIRYWDYVGYWSSTVNVSNIFGENVANGMKVLIKSIYNDEYNIFPPLFLQSVFFISEKSKWAYILSIFIIYTIPVISCFAVIFSRNIKSNSSFEFNLKLIIGMIIIIFSPGLNLPSLLGYLDIIGVVFISIILLIMNDYDFVESKFKNMALIGISLILLFISRRWYAYWIVGYFVALIISTFITDICIERQIKIFFKKIKNICILGIVLLAIVLMFFYPVVSRILQSNFSFAYSAYKQGGRLLETMNFIKSLGIITSLFMFVGIIASLKNKIKRSFSLIVLIIPIVCIILFNFIQTMGIQHRYLLLPSAIYFQFIGCTSLIDVLKRFKLKIIVALGSIIIYVANFIISIEGMETKNLFTDNSCKPIVMQNYDEISNIVKFVQDKYSKSKEKTYVLASSAEYNESIIASYYMPDMKMQNMIYNVNCIDLRDGFPQQFLDAKYVIVVDPIQYHMRPSDQRTIGILAEAVLNEPTINKHYEIENVDKDVNNQKIYYLRQVTPLDDEAKQFFASEFDKYYANYPDLFKNRILKNVKK